MGNNTLTHEQLSSGQSAPSSQFQGRLISNHATNDLTHKHDTVGLGKQTLPTFALHEALVPTPKEGRMEGDCGVVVYESFYDG